MGWTRGFAVMVALAAASAACSSGSPTKASSDTAPDFRGSYSGTSSVAGCAETGGFAGFCQAVGFTNGTTFPIALTLNQTQNNVTGSIALLGLTGTLQGTASGSSGLQATGTLGDVTDSGVTLSSSIASWSTTLNGNALSGSYQIVFRTNATSGTATVNASIVQLTR